MIFLNCSMTPEVEKAFKDLCVSFYSHSRTEYVLEVANILQSPKKAKLSIVIKHFIKLNPTAYKMIDLVRYIRANRNRLFPNNYKNSNQKFIKVFGWNRTTSIAFYIVESGLIAKFKG